MREYGKIKSAFWIDGDERVASMDDAERLLFAYLMSGPHTTALGCFYAPDGYMANDLRWPVSKLSGTVAKLVAKGFACRTASGWVWLRKFLRHNTPESPNVWKHIERLAKAIPADVPFREAVITDLVVYREELRNPSAQHPEEVLTPEPEPFPEPNPTGAESPTGTVPPKFPASIDDLTETDAELVALAEKNQLSWPLEIQRWRDWKANAPKPTQRNPKNQRASARNWLRNPIGKTKGTAGGPRTRHDPRIAARIVAARMAGGTDGAGGHPAPDHDRRGQRVRPGSGPDGALPGSPRAEVFGPNRDAPSDQSRPGHLAVLPIAGGDRVGPGRDAESAGALRADSNDRAPREARAADTGTISTDRATQEPPNARSEGGPQAPSSTAAHGGSEATGPRETVGRSITGMAGTDGAADALDAYEREHGIIQLLDRTRKSA